MKNGDANPDEKKGRRVKLIPSTYEGRTLTGVELPYRDKTVEIVARQSKFYDEVLSLAELPGPEEWRKILEVSEQHGIPSIWRRSRASVLENGAAALLTALAFSNQKEQTRLIQDFFKSYGLNPGLRGRPRLHLGQTRDLNRGIQIDRIMTRLQEGFQLKRAVLSEHDGSVEQYRETQLRRLGYDNQEIASILKCSTLQSAAFLQYQKTTGKTENVDMKAIRNSYSRYKQVRDLPRRSVPQSQPNRIPDK